MKSINLKLTFTFIVACIFVAISCKKDKNTSGSTAKDVITAKDYVYNLFTKTLTPEADVNANIKSEVGIKLIYSYLVRDQQADSLVNIAFVPEENQKDYDLVIPTSSFSKTNMNGVTGIKTVIKRIDNSTDEGSITLTSFQPPLPVLSDFPAKKLPDDNNKILITGKATSETGLSKIEILDDSQGSFTVVNTIDNLNGVKSYDVNYTYTYRANTANIQIIAYDTFNITTSAIINVPALPFTTYQNVTMGAQGNSSTTVTNNHFFIATGTTGGSCTLNADESTLDFLFYGTSSGPSLYSPTNATNIAKNFYCNGTNNFWNTSTTDFTTLKPTRFRVLVPGDGGVIDALYTKFNANDIPDLNDDGFFSGISVPSGSTAKYVSGGTNSTSQYDVTNAYLIWVRVPTTPAATAYKNCLMRVKSAVDATNVSTITFDIYVQK